MRDTSTTPWLTILGLGEDGPDGLTPAGCAALERAEIVMGASRHLALLPAVSAEQIRWPVPFADGIAPLLALRGRRVVVLASGDPFWFGAGSVLARHLSPGEWHALPGPAIFTLVAARMGWALEGVGCFGLHAAPLTRLRPALHPGVRLIALLRDGASVDDLAAYLHQAGFGASSVSVLESVGGMSERRTDVTADALCDAPPIAEESASASALPGVASGAIPRGGFRHPVCVAVMVAGSGAVLPLAPGRAEDWFDHDGQITRRPVRALTLSALAPRGAEHLWDIGSGSGSIAIEWLLAGPRLAATSIEPRADRAATIRANADRLGMDRLAVVNGRAPDALEGLMQAGAPRPDAVFIGGGLSDALLHWLWQHLPPGTRVVANAVTLGSEALLIAAQAARGGDLLRVELAQAGTLGPKAAGHRGWKAAYPIVQWSVTR
ncbi:precorrin-6y C5,15-methyltransferase (decarboxylating) subunit CbiE [Roseicitreum antarcticum]|uniref:Precorrin-6Y C5,15-methyltransferase (Decarboxylating) n=1 Tax=Roseicitreum antarcticum TaxID=564137 RepID=A0A1H2UBX1_9RHOB|nr:precorrin-6y C5,15-methyltransferase (decarboxylating) subunit CbiE [Roseicitreum antarcticum]SDW53681.1 precorrin-6Y C5,15-methyltransferase (decarboxylating) [Roseicitreum antarcticum]